jgi:hypothetical protein
MDALTLILKSSLPVIGAKRPIFLIVDRGPAQRVS